ncbi:MAG: flagellar hook capping FlgD N-terminal domain-containing protein [Pseudomonadota bacterium]
MTVSAITTPASPATGVAGKKTDLNTDYTTFLKMLTTQLQNQDPLNPMDTGETSSQLAAFSSVEQQTRTNDLLSDLGAQFSLFGMSQLATWVGQEARADAPVWYSGAAVTLSPNPAERADRVVLVVRDTAGAVVSREDMPLGNAPYEWFGADATGNPLPEGSYALTLENYSGDALLGESAVESYQRILEARNGPAGTTLVLQGGIEVLATEITALRQT